LDHPVHVITNVSQLNGLWAVIVGYHDNGVGVPLSAAATQRSETTQQMPRVAGDASVYTSCLEKNHSSKSDDESRLILIDLRAFFTIVNRMKFLRDNNLFISQKSSFVYGRVTVTMDSSINTYA